MTRRGLYRPRLDAVLRGERPWRSVDSLIGKPSASSCARGIAAFSEDELVELNRVWQRLEPWPDTIPGLLRLKRRYVVATLSNTDMAAVVRMAKHSALPWDVIRRGS